MNDNKRKGFSLNNNRKINPTHNCHICSRFSCDKSCLLCNNITCDECLSESINYCILCKSNAPNNNFTAIRVPTEIDQNTIIYVKNKKKIFCCFI